MGEGVNPVQRLAVAGVFRAHHADGLARVRAAARPEQRKQDGLFLLHVAQQFLLHLFQQRGQTGWHVGVFAVHRFNAARHAHQFGQLHAVNLVVAADDVVDQRGGGHVVSPCIGPLQGGELAHHVGQIQVFVQCRLPEADEAAAAEVQFQLPENGSRAGQAHGDLPQ